MNNQSAVLLKTIQAKKPELYQAMRQYGASNLRIFGSVANGTANIDSDIDFMVDIVSPPHSILLARLGLQREFSHILGHEVDVTNSAKMLPKIANPPFKSGVVSV
ncbi:nucleotidyltransferase domain-containing protein [Candidatus Saccharibacteria bacterium]|nr:nucleotidyltransferase domain-containing protein [Candidatus Saccharibacteria bacterium]